MREQPETLEPLAGVVQRLAVLLTAGVAPGSAWEYLAEAATGRIRPILQDVALCSARGDTVEGILAAATSTTVAVAAPRWVSRQRSRQRSSNGVAALAWLGLAAAWVVATQAGASLAPTLRDVAQSLRDLATTQRELGVALAGPKATAKLVLVLPVVGVLFGVALGFDSLGVLFATVPGALCLAVGIALMFAARGWNRRLVRSATPRDPMPGLELDLLAIAVSGGASIDRARLAVSGALERCALAASGSPETIEEILALSRRAGVPAAALLRSEAQQARASARSAAQEAAGRLTVTLMMPLGLCILPAFMLLGVAPLMIAVLSSTVTGL